MSAFEPLPGCVVMVSMCVMSCSILGLDKVIESGSHFSISIDRCEKGGVTFMSIAGGSMGSNMGLLSGAVL